MRRRLRHGRSRLRLMPHEKLWIQLRRVALRGLEERVQILIIQRRGPPCSRAITGALATIAVAANAKITILFIIFVLSLCVFICTAQCFALGLGKTQQP